MASSPHDRRGQLRPALAALLLGLAPTPLAAQDHDLQQWTLLVAQGPIKDDLLLQAEIQPRLTNDASRLGQFQITPAIGYRLSKGTSVFIGYMFVHTDPVFVHTDPVDRPSFDEHRIYQQVVYACREDVARPSFSPVLRRAGVQLVVTGGGCATPLHSRFITALRSPKRVLGPGEIIRPEPPGEIAQIDCDRSRLLLAFGLAHDNPDIPPPTLPSRIPKIAPKPDNRPGYVGPEQV